MIMIFAIKFDPQLFSLMSLPSGWQNIRKFNRLQIELQYLWNFKDQLKKVLKLFGIPEFIHISP